MRHIKTLRIPKDRNSSERLEIRIYRDVDSKFYARTKDPIFRSSPSVFLPASNLRDAEREANLLLEVSREVAEKADRPPLHPPTLEPAYIRDLVQSIESLLHIKIE